MREEVDQNNSYSSFCVSVKGYYYLLLLLSYCALFQPFRATLAIAAEGMLLLTAREMTFTLCRDGGVKEDRKDV